MALGAIMQTRSGLYAGLDRILHGLLFRHLGRQRLAAA